MTGHERSPVQALEHLTVIDLADLENAEHLGHSTAGIAEFFDVKAAGLAFVVMTAPDGKLAGSAYGFVVMRLVLGLITTNPRRNDSRKAAPALVTTNARPQVTLR
jgi:hypothetical protein